MTKREPNPADRAFGRHVRSCRRTRGFTQDVLAERSGLSSDTIRRLEQGSFSPSLETLRKLGGGLGLQLSTIFLAHDLREPAHPHEFLDAVSSLDEEERRQLLRHLYLLLALLRDGVG